MKVSFLLIILIIMAIPILMSFTNARIEKQKYRVIKKEKEFEIRFYPPAIFATTRSVENLTGKWETPDSAKLQATYLETTKPPPR